MRLDPANIGGFARGKVHKDNSKVINSMDFTADGTLLVTGSDDESIHVYNCESGEHEKTVLSKKYGVDLVRFTHAKNTVICASKNEWDDTVRSLSLHDNSYLRYFKGHRARVVSLAMSPISDQFMSASLDKSVRLWDLRTNACQGLLHVPDRPCVNYDPKGLIFAAATGNVIKVYDVRSHDKGPFDEWTLFRDRNVDVSCFRFSPDGKYVLVVTSDGSLVLLDAFSGQQVQHYGAFTNGNGMVIDVSFSPDGQFVLAGSDDSCIHIWETVSGREVCALKGHVDVPGCVRFNPRKAMIASACTNLVFWIPQ